MNKTYIADDPKLRQYVEEWHPTKNGSLTPNNTMKGSGRTLWWKCKQYGHEWDATPLARISQSQGCPICSGNRILKGFNDLATTNPELASSWHPTLNTEFAIDEISANSNKKAWWKCPVGDNHVWEAIIQSRHKGNGCPYCSNRKVLAGFNDFGSSKEYSHIAAEWNPKNELRIDEVSPSSNKKVWWICQEGHEWEAIIANRTKKGSGCPVCRKTKNQKSTPEKLPAPTLPKVSETPLANEWHPNNPAGPESYTTGSNFKALWKCSIDSRHEWEAEISNRVRGSGCLVCSGRKIVPGINDLASSKEHQHLVEQWHPDNELSPSEVGYGSVDTKFKWICSEGHVWVTNIHARVNFKQGCPECIGRSAWQEKRRVVSDYPELLSQWHSSNTLDPTVITFRSKQDAIWQCSKDARHIWTASPMSRSLDGSDCPVCAGRVVVQGVNDLASSTLFQPIAKEWHPDNAFSPNEVTPGSNRKAKWLCSKNSKHVWEAVIYGRVHSAIQRGCPHCAAEAQSSLGERQLLEILEKFGFTPKQSERRVIPNRELDLYLPEKKFAIEFNGLYWHSDSVRPDKMYHANKLASCQANGLTLFNVWEDDWKFKKDIVIRDLATRLDKLNTLDDILPHEPKHWHETIDVSSLKMAKITKDEARQFFDKHHIQGATPSEFYFGMRDGKNRIRSAMAVSKSSIIGEYKINRYASAGTVVDGFSKLVEMLENILPVEKWIILSDNSSSDDSLFIQNGFALDEVLDPDYSYVSQGKRVNKSNYRPSRFQKDSSLLFKKGLKEKELADINGILRIWDFGKNRYVKQVSN